MTRRPWREDEVSAVSQGWSWAEFHEVFPERTYDAWEVKRRRVAGGSAGSNRRAINARRLRADKAERALRTIAEFLGVDL